MDRFDCVGAGRAVQGYFWEIDLNGNYGRVGWFMGGLVYGFGLFILQGQFKQKRIGDLRIWGFGREGRDG